MTQENINNLENNEVPKTTPEKVEQKEISQEEFLNWLDNEGNNFKQETQQELDKANSVDLDQSTFEKIKNETGVEQELSDINQNAEQIIFDAKSSLGESLETSSNTPLSLEEVFNTDSERITGLRLKEFRTSEEDIELLNDRIEKLIKFRGYMMENRQNFSGKEIDDVGGMIEDFQTQQRGVLNQMIIEKQSTEKADPLSSARETFQKNEIEKIQSANSLGELYKILKETGGIQGSSEFYSTDQLWERVRAYINNEADENVITRTGGLREKVKELKRQREASKDQENSVSGNKETIEEKTEVFGEGFKTVNVQRSNGEVEQDWKLMNIENGQATVMKKDAKTGEVIQKIIPQVELESLNPANESKYNPGRRVTIKRSNGAIESDWRIGDKSRMLDGKKVITVYKGDYPPKEGTVYREVYEEDLDQLNK